MSAVDLTHSEVRLHKLIQSWGLTLPIEMSHLNLGLFWIPILHVADWMEHMLRKEPRVLLGGYTFSEKTEIHLHLKAFWTAYQLEDGDHPVYTTHKDRLQFCVPYFLYLDEGRGYRKSPVMLIAFEAVLGLPTRAAFKAKGPREFATEQEYLDACLDAQAHTAKGNSLTSRFIVTALPHSWYRKTKHQDRSHVFHKTLEEISKSCENLFHKGITDMEGNRWYGIFIGLKGDSPALAKAGRLNATFMHLGRNRRMCHFCDAGLDGIPWEDTTPSAAWKLTTFNTRPWTIPSELLRIPFCRNAPEKMYRNDAFHVIKYGIGRHYTASIIVCLCDFDIWPGQSGSVEAKFERAYRDFRECCKRDLKACPHLKAFTREMLHYGTKNDFPFGGWKGADTMLLLRWMVRLIRYGAYNGVPRPQVPLATTHPGKRELLEAMLDGACSLVLFFQIINKAGLWLSQEQATKIMTSVETFVTCYTFLASQMHAAAQARFHMEPSLHLLHHMGFRLQQQQHATRILNPAAWLAEAGEDFIGKAARVSRRVSARLTGQRTMQRMLIQTYFAWQALEQR